MSTSTTTTSTASTSITTASTTATSTTTTITAEFPTGVITVGDSELRVWLAADAEERTQGLREVERLPTDVSGMLFVFDPPTRTVFVMEDTLIPLDVWFFDAEGELIGAYEMTPCSIEPCQRYPTPGPVRWALETPLGDHEFQLGDELSTSPSS